jgi:hypothetical protein
MSDSEYFPLNDFPDDSYLEFVNPINTIEVINIENVVAKIELFGITNTTSREECILQLGLYDKSAKFPIRYILTNPICNMSEDLNYYMEFPLITKDLLYNFYSNDPNVLLSIKYTMDELTYFDTSCNPVFGFTNAVLHIEFKNNRVPVFFEIGYEHVMCPVSLLDEYDKQIINYGSFSTRYENNNNFNIIYENKNE